MAVFDNNSNSGCNKMIILIVFLLVIGSPHIIIEVTPNTSIVSTTNQLNIKILTNTSIANNTLTISFNTGFTLSSPCTVNGTATNCSFATSTTSVTATIGSAMAANNNYLITLNVTNPIYASNFQIVAAVSGVAFINTGVVTINPKTITCQLTPSSQFVGDTPIGYFQINNDALPANSIITINSTVQSTFPNLFNSGPACTIGNTSYSCSLSTSFGQQFLTLNSPPQTSNLNLAVSTINNPPYNSTFLNIAIQIQNSGGNFMQVCSFQQQAVSKLRPSTSLALSSWNNQVGSTSTVSITLRTYFKPYSTSLIWVYPAILSVTILSPASGLLTTQNGSTSNFITGATAVGNSLTFSAQITNPTSVQQLSSQIYVVYSSTQFIQQLSYSNMSLAALIFTPVITLSEYKTQYSSSYNIAISIPYTITSGFSGSLTLLYGELLCNNFSLLSSTSLSNNSCTTTTLSFSSTSTLPQGTFWISFNAQNYYSTRNNSITISLTSLTSYSIGSGASSFNLNINSHSFIITNTNPVFANQTQITITQQLSLINLNPSISRTIILYLPKDLVFSANTSVTALNSTTSITASSINSSASTITLNTIGPVNIRINNIANPVKYNGSLQWTISAFDLLSNPSSTTTATMQPMYTQTIPYLTYQMSNSIIQASNTVILTLIPALQYYSPPTITITFSDSLVLNCSNCTIVTSTSLTITYYATIMKITIGVKNSNHPINNNIKATIAQGFITYETTTVSYNLQPMTYGYVATQSGLYGTLGYVNITITSKPTQTLTLSYSNVSAIINNPTCVSCTNTLIYLSGIVQYFQQYAVTLTGTFNGVVYASAVASISYVCSSIQGCNICVNQTINQTTTLKCQQCFDITFTPYCLLYNNQCLQSCPIQTYSNGFTCVSCPNLCYICSSDKCNQCFSGYYIYNNTCLSSCPPPLVNNATHCISVPISCPTNCANCPLNDVCTACNGGYYLLNNICYSPCPSGYRAKGSVCVLFTPPQQTSYFPFPFLISSGIIFITLLAMKRFEKRSLVMGNLIAFVSVVQVGSMLLTLVYALQSSQDLLTQSLCFILLFSKILINLIFLCYFVKAIASQEQFEAWRQIDQSHERLYKALIILSSILSFQVMRIIYSRLMGLRLFFGKFNTSLIFKPLNYFTITYFFTAGAALVALSALTIVLQQGYRTSAFYTSVQSIIIQALLLIICIVDNKKGYDDEFFQYQIYKVNNQYQSSHIDVVDIEHQDGNASSMHQMINAVSSAPRTRKKGSQIIRNPRWVKKIAKPLSYPDEQPKPDEMGQIQQVDEKVQNVQLPVQSTVKAQEVKTQNIIIQEPLISASNQDNNGRQQQAENVIQNKKESLFRRKIIEDWRQIQSTLPNKMKQIRNINNGTNSAKKKKSVSPDNRRKKQGQRKALKRVSSMQQIQIKLPQSSQSISERIREYFNQQKISSNKKNEQNGNKFQDKKQPHAQNKGYIPLQQPKSMTLQIQDSSQGKSLQGLLNGSQHGYQEEHQGFSDYNIDTRRRLKEGNQIQELFPSGYNQSGFEEQTQGQSSNNPNINQENHSSKQEEMQEIQENEIELQAESNKKINLGNYRYKGDEQKQKHYKTKRKRVNRQTEQVYLQRLVASSHRKTRNSKARKLQF